MDNSEGTSTTLAEVEKEKTTSPNRKKWCDGIDNEKLPRDYLISNGELLKALVFSRYLGRQELKNLFLSKPNKDLKWAFFGAFGNKGDTTAKIAEDAIWKAILYASCSFPVQDVTSLLRDTGLSAKACATQILGLHKEEEHADDVEVETIPHPLQYSSSDYAIVVTLKGLGEKLVCKSVRGQDAEPLFDSGKVTIQFDEPLYQKQLKDEHGFDIHVVSEVRIIRIGPGNHQHNPVLFLGSETEHLFVDRSCKSIRLGGHQSYADPMRAGYGQKLMRFFFRNTDKLCVRVDLEFRKVNDTCSHRQNHTSTIQVVGITLMGMFGPCDCVEYGEDFSAWKCNPIKSGNVSFAHFIEALEGW